MSYCEPKKITDAAFENLRGIYTLDMQWCRQVTITAFENLRGIHTLNMSYCTQETITPRIFEYLPVSGIHSLNTDYCSPILRAARAALSTENRFV